MTNELPDVQASTPDVTVGLSQVGVTGVEKLVKLARKDKRPIVLMAEFKVYVDLPRKRKGIDMSRNMEVIDETLEVATREPAYRVESVCGAIADRLLEKHEYTTTAMVEMEAEYMTLDETPVSKVSTQGSVDIIASATAHENASTSQEIGVRATGMTVCPCSQEMMSATARETLRNLGVGEKEVKTFLREVPQAGHSQRGQATITVRTEGLPDVDLRDLVAIARDAMSARIYNLAKRPDEDHMTYEAHANARFVEDCVRAMAEQIVETYPGLPNSTVITMRQSNDESIHQHNANAERVATLSELRAEVDDVAE